MDELEREHVRQWIRNWEAAGPVLQRLRDEAILASLGSAAIQRHIHTKSQGTRQMRPEGSGKLLRDKELRKYAEKMYLTPLVHS